MSFHIQMRLGVGNYFRQNESDSFDKIQGKFLTIIKEMDSEKRDVTIQLYYKNKIMLSWSLGDDVEEVKAAVALAA